MTNEYQQSVHAFMLACFGEAIAADKAERYYRFLEEALELVQSLGCSKADAIRMVDYVFNRPPGDVANEVGGTMVTLAALCNATQIDMQAAGKIELNNCLTKIDGIRAKHLSKPLRADIAP